MGKGGFRQLQCRGVCAKRLFFWGFRRLTQAPLHLLQSEGIGLVGFEPTASWSRTRRSTKLSHSPFYRICPANAVLTSRILHQIARRSRGGRSVSVARLEITLWSSGQKALTTSRFIWKVSTHFYYARTATCSIRPHKQRGDYPSIPDRGGAPRSFLAPYDHSTSSGSSTGYPESANSD